MDTSPEQTPHPVQSFVPLGWKLGLRPSSPDRLGLPASPGCNGGCGPRSRWREQRGWLLSRPFFTLLAIEDVRDVGLLDLGARQVDPGATLVTLNHGPTGKWLLAVTCDEVP